jgi:hypothetical protein
MGLKIVCSGHLVRHPLGGHSWHHLQYLVGFRRLGHEVVFIEDYGWPDSCYDVARQIMTSDPAYGIAYLRALLGPHGLDQNWCYLSEDGAAHGLSREQLTDACRDCDVYLNLSGVNQIRETALCRRRALVDTDPVFTQIGAHGCGGPFSDYQALFTFGENVHRPGCSMPTGGGRWLPTRQPVVTDLWAVRQGDATAPFTTVMNWSAYGDHRAEGRVYGQKDREFGPFFSLPSEVAEPMEIAVGAPPAEVARRLATGGWRLSDPLEVTRTPSIYQSYLAASRAEFCVAKHGYVSTRCGWFSERSTSYLASGRPVVVQDTGFSDFLPCGKGLMVFRTPEEARTMVRGLRSDYAGHCRAARGLVEEYFDSRRVLSDMLTKCL